MTKHLLRLPLMRVLTVKPLRAMTEEDVLSLAIVPKQGDKHPVYQWLFASKIAAVKKDAKYFTVTVEYA